MVGLTKKGELIGGYQNKDVSNYCHEKKSSHILQITYQEMYHARHNQMMQSLNLSTGRVRLEACLWRNIPYLSRSFLFPGVSSTACSRTCDVTSDTHNIIHRSSKPATAIAVFGESKIC